MNFEQKKNTKAAAWTVGVHSVLLLIFILCKYTMPAEAKVEDLGMEVNLGTSDNGSGTDQPEAMDDPAAANAATAANAAAASNSNDKEINTTEDNDAPSVNITHPKPVNKPSTQPVNNTPNRKPSANNNNSNATVTAPAQSPRYVYPGATGKGGNGAQQNTPGTSEGIGTGNGDMGVPGGTPGASNYTGTPGLGGGSSMRVSIAGRNLVSRPDPKAEFKEGGQVVIHVTVNRDGVITESRVVRAANATIRALALKKLSGVKFNKSANAPAEQFGDITFDFRATRK
jgi:outer membrane biosynthesis protein TonB